MKKGISTILAVCITVIVMLAMAAGGWYYMDKTAKETNQALENRIESLEADLNIMLEAKEDEPDLKAESEESDSTAQWTDYTNKEFGFRIKYPSGWRVAETLQAAGDASTVENYFKLSTTDASITIYIDPMGWGDPTPEVSYVATMVGNRLTLSNRTLVPDPGEEGIAQEEGRIAFIGRPAVISSGSHDIYISAVNLGLKKEQTIVQILSTFEFII